MSRILVIDDDAGLLQMVKLMLEREGHQPILAEGGEAGVKAALSQAPDLAVIDLMMPGMSGYDVTRRLRADETTAQLPILILTARSQPMDKQMALNAGANAFMSKPVSSRELTERIAEILSEKGVAPPPITFPQTPSVETAAPSPIRRLPIGADAQSGTPPSGRTAPLPTLAPAAASAMTPPVFKAPDKPLPVLAVLGLYTGAGATTLAINLTFALRRTLERLCLIDLNMVNGQAATYLHLTPRGSWADLLTLGDKLEARTVGTVITAHPQPGVGLIGSPATPPPRSLTADAMVGLLTTLTQGFQATVVDINGLTPASIATLMVARTVFAVVSDDPAALQNVANLSQTLHALNIDLTKIGLVVNHNRPEAGVSGQAIARAAGLPISAELPYDVNQIQAIRRGVPTVVTAPESPFALAVQQLARAL